MPLTLAALFAQPDNAPVLAYLRAQRDDELELGRPSPFDEGGGVFTQWSSAVPEDTRCTLGTVNLLVHPETARIFALHQGRLTIAVRTGATEPAKLVGQTLDDHVDLRALGAGWELHGHIDDDEDDPFTRAYALAATAC